MKFVNAILSNNLTDDHCRDSRTHSEDSFRSWVFWDFLTYQMKFNQQILQKMEKRHDSLSDVNRKPHIFFDQLSKLGKPSEVKNLHNRNITIAKYNFCRYLNDLSLPNAVQQFFNEYFQWNNKEDVLNYIEAIYVKSVNKTETKRNLIDGEIRTLLSKLMVTERQKSNITLDPTKTYFVVDDSLQLPGFNFIEENLTFSSKIAFVDNAQAGPATKMLSEYLTVSILIRKENVTSDVTEEEIIKLMKMTETKMYVGKVNTRENLRRGVSEITDIKNPKPSNIFDGFLS